jgi:hypothetical protein
VYLVCQNRVIIPLYPRVIRDKAGTSLRLLRGFPDS